MKRNIIFFALAFPGRMDHRPADRRRFGSPPVGWAGGGNCPLPDGAQARGTWMQKIAAGSTAYGTPPKPFFYTIWTGKEGSESFSACRKWWSIWQGSGAAAIIISLSGRTAMRTACLWIRYWNCSRVWNTERSQAVQRTAVSGAFAA